MLNTAIDCLKMSPPVVAICCIRFLLGIRTKSCFKSFDSKVTLLQCMVQGLAERQKLLDELAKTEEAAIDLRDELLACVRQPAPSGLTKKDSECQWGQGLSQGGQGVQSGLAWATKQGTPSTAAWLTSGRPPLAPLNWAQVVTGCAAKPVTGADAEEGGVRKV